MKKEYLTKESTPVADTDGDLIKKGGSNNDLLADIMNR